MILPNSYILNLRPYKLTSHKAWEIENKGKVLKLDWNEATIPPSPKVKKYILEFLEKGNLNWYPDVDNKRLKYLLSNYINLPEENILYFSGSDSAHEYICRAFINPGDNILMISPTYDNFRATAEASGALIYHFFLDIKKNFFFNQKEFINYLKNNNFKIVYICNPNNPTGNTYSVEFFKYLLKNFQNTLFIIDEAYIEFGGESAKDLVVKYDNVIITRTFSKAFALASFRVGYIIASKNIIEVLSKLRNPKNVPTLSQIAAIAALEDIDYMKTYVKEVNNTKKWFLKELKKIGIKTYGKAGNFILLYIPNKKDKLIKYLEKNYIFVRDYSHVERMKDFIRITIGTKKQMEIVLEKIKEFYKK